MTRPGRRSFLIAGSAVAVVSVLPFARGLLAGQAFYFRDLSREFIPLRLWVLDGLRHGELRYWLPLVHEGTPAPFPPVSYPLELLQLLAPSETGLSLYLALHVALAALLFMTLARGWGLRAGAAAGGALIYALGGFAVSTLNFYVYLPALAWAPPLVLWVGRAAEGGRRAAAAAAILTAVCLSTAGIEIALQATALGVLVGLGRQDAVRRLVRVGVSLALGAALAAPTLLVTAAVVRQSARAAGFPTDVVLAWSVHPLSLVQIVSGNFFGDLNDLANSYWGENFFTEGFPYVLSLYLGATAVTLAIVGVRHGGRFRQRLALAAVAALILSMGHWVGLAPLVDAIPALHKFRGPVKLFFTVHFVVAILAAQGLDRLASGHRPSWRALTEWALVLGSLLVAAGAAPWVAPEPTRWFLWGFMPWGSSWPQRYADLGAILRDAATGGGLAIAAGLLSAAVLWGRLRAVVASVALLLLLAVDLLRTGAGLNPMVTADFYRLAPEVAAQMKPLAHNPRARLYVCEPINSRAYWLARRLRPGNHEAWTFEVYRQLEAPFANVADGVATARSQDMTSLVPVRFVAGLQDNCRDMDTLLPDLRAAGVTHVASLEPVDHAWLRLASRTAPFRLAPLDVLLYEMVDRPAWAYVVEDGPGARPLPGAEASFERPQAGRIAVAVESPGAGRVVVREAHARGWTARVDGHPGTVGRTTDGHIAVPVRAGRSNVVLAYRPPGLTPGLVAMAAAWLVTALLIASGTPPASPGPGALPPRTPHHATLA